MSYTEMYMLATAPNCRVLPTIGSVAKNFASTEDNTFTDFMCRTPEAESIRSTFGEVAYMDYVEGMLANRNGKVEKVSKKAPSTEKRSKPRRWIAKIKQVYREYYL